MTDIPKDPFTGVGQMAATVHEVYLGFLGAGFAADQALALTQTFLTAFVLRQANKPLTP